MPLSPGARLEPYEVVGAIGAGGMGEVYRARDSSLGRDVALKILPARVANHPDRLARFGREAQLLGSVNPPRPGDDNEMTVVINWTAALRRRDQR